MALPMLEQQFRQRGEARHPDKAKWVCREIEMLSKGLIRSMVCLAVLEMQACPSWSLIGGRSRAD